jgi:dihydroxyacetone kinase-like protein
MPDKELALLDAGLEDWARHADDLARLDAATGDGDMGITVAQGAAAVREALRELVTQEREPGLSTILSVTGKAFARGNPSTLAALVGSGLMAAATATAQLPEVDRRSLHTAAEAAAHRIMERGGAQEGDKTLLDALLPSIAALDTAQGSPAAILEAMIAAAEEGIAKTTEVASRHGRAAWLGERGVGVPDAGAMAWLLLLQSLHTAATATGTAP